MNTKVEADKLELLAQILILQADQWRDDYNAHQAAERLEDAAHALRQVVNHLTILGQQT